MNISGLYMPETERIIILRLFKSVRLHSRKLTWTKTPSEWQVFNSCVLMLEQLLLTAVCRVCVNCGRHVSVFISELAAGCPHLTYGVCSELVDDTSNSFHKQYCTPSSRLIRSLGCQACCPISVNFSQFFSPKIQRWHRCTVTVSVKNCSPASKTQLYTANHQCWFSKQDEYIFNVLPVSGVHNTKEQLFHSMIRLKGLAFHLKCL